MIICLGFFVGAKSLTLETLIIVKIYSVLWIDTIFDIFGNLLLVAERNFI